MNFNNINDFYLFFIFFIPGFISLKVYDLLIPNKERDFSKSIYEVFAYSALNFAALSWLIYLAYHYNVGPIIQMVILFMVLFFMPVLWPVALVKISSLNCIAKHIIHPVKKPWDFVFGKKESFWIVLTMKNGVKIGGKYDSQSFASSYPSEEQIYIQEVWKLDEDCKFIHVIERSRGILVSGKDILTIEFLK